jgi:hypothetical protein
MTFTLGGSVVTPTYILKYLQPLDNQAVGNYHATFLTEGLSEGEYTITLSGTYGATTLTDTATLKLKSVLQTEYLIDLVRISLGDYRNLAIPRKYVTFPSDNRVWADGELYNFLLCAVNDVNNAVPITPDEFTTESCPITSLIVMGAQIYALNAVSAIETANFFDFSAGTTRVSMYKGDKYYQLASFIEKNYLSRIQAWKKYWSWQRVNSRVLNMSKTPTRISRPISDNLFYSSLRNF